jgi:hypothetical protein
MLITEQYVLRYEQRANSRCGNRGECRLKAIRRCCLDDVKHNTQRLRCRFCLLKHCDLSALGLHAALQRNYQFT